MKLSQDFAGAALAEELCTGGHVLPTEEPAQELRGGDRLDFATQPAEGEAMDAGEEAAFAPFGVGGGRVSELAAKDSTRGFDLQ